METLIRERRDGKEETWYSPEYVRKQIELAYSAGLSVGVQVEIHAVQPMDEHAVNDLTNHFWDKVRDEYFNRLKDGFVHNLGGRREFNVT